MYGEKPPSGSQYYCRGCGGILPAEWHGQFHPECLKRDKQLRTQEKRRVEREKLLASLRDQHCPHCGCSLADEAAVVTRKKSGAGKQSSPEKPGRSGAERSA